MIERRIVRRYASALFSAAFKAEVVDRVESDLGLVTYALEMSPDMLEAVRSPLVPAEKKRAIISGVFADKIHEITLSYLNLLVDKGREEAMMQTEEEYILLANDARGVITAQATSAVRLTEEEQSRIKVALAEMTGKIVELQNHIDPELIGGVLVQIGDSVIDGSVKGQLAALRERLLS